MRPRNPAGRLAATPIAMGPENDSASSTNGFRLGRRERTNASSAV